MKISFLVRWLPPRIDGVGDYTWNLACVLRKYGIGVCVFTTAGQGCKGLVENEWVFPIIKQWQPKEVVKALRSITRDAPDWFCFQYVPQMYGYWGICLQVAGILLALKKGFRCKIAITFHEIISSWGLNSRDILLASITRLQTKRLLSVADLAITTCSRYKDILQRFSPHSLSVAAIPTGSNIEPIFIAPEELVELRKKIFPEGAKIFGLFSRISPYRNFPLALKTLKEARGQGLNAWLYLIGKVESYNPGLFQDMMKLAQKLQVRPYIISTGELSKEDLSIQLKAVDVFIFPQTDGISTRNGTLMAAMAHGLPVVSFKPQAGNFDNFQIPCGVLVDKGDEAGFIQAAVECLKKYDILSKAGQANSDYYYKNFSWPVIAKRYLEALEA